MNIKHYRFEMKNAVLEKLKESAKSALPLILIVSLLCIFAVPIENGIMLAFLIGAIMLIVGIGLFGVGAEQAMTPIGNKIGTVLMRTRNMPLILVASFLLGFAVTVAEPDLQVLAATVPHISSIILLITVGVGVGAFTALCMFRILQGLSLKKMLIFFYCIVFVLAYFTKHDFLGIAFDSGGVTTGPMTVPFILALGIGVANTRSDSKAEADSFGLVALCSIGPIVSVLVLGFFYDGVGVAPEATAKSYLLSNEIGIAFIKALPSYMLEMLVSLLPIVVIFIIFQLFSFKMPRHGFVKILVGILYTYIGLVLFLTGVNVGFSSLGAMLGTIFAESDLTLLIIPLSALLGWFVISAEPAVGVLQKQIEQVSAGAISGKAIKLSLSAAVAIATGIAATRAIYGISLMWFLIPGYFVALLLSFFVPDIYTAIAFDSGGVASGPMTATFILQMMIGLADGLGESVLRNAFGVVALVAMVPLISIQAVGLASEIRRKKQAPKPEIYGDTDIIELWGD